MGLKKTGMLSLKEMDNDLYNRIADKARSWQAQYCGASIIKDNIFPSIKNYVRKYGRDVEMMFFPFGDEDIRSIGLLKENVFFLSLNTENAVSDEIFTAAVMSYHILRCLEEDESSSFNIILTSKTLDYPSSRRDFEAGLFARALMMSDTLLYEMSVIHNIDLKKPDVRTILLLMSLFALPLRCVVIRLFECSYITKEDALALLAAEKDEINEEMRLTGIGKRWLESGAGTESFGSLYDNYEFNRKNGFLTDNRIRESEAFLEEIRKRLTSSGTDRGSSDSGNR